MPDTKKVKQAKAAPTKKVAVGAAAGAISAIVVWALNVFMILPNGVQIPGEIGSALTTILTFVVAYVVPPAASDGIITADS